MILSCQSNKDNPENGEWNNLDSKTSDFQQNINQIDTLLNTESYLVLGDKLGKVKVVSEKEVDDFPTFEIIGSYGIDVIIGQTIDYDNLKIYRKYQPQTSFKDFPVEIYEGKLADPDFSTYPDAKGFITHIKNECAKGINFAGKYTLVTWGCGSPCQSGVVVDRKTGEIFSGYETSLGAEFRKDSKMIIKNVGAIDTTTNLIEFCAYCEVNHEIWTGSGFQKVE